MIDKRSTIGKMIDGTKVIYQCLQCGRHFVGDKDTNINYCPLCKRAGEETKPQVVIVENLIVRK